MKKNYFAIVLCSALIMFFGCIKENENEGKKNWYTEI